MARLKSTPSISNQRSEICNLFASLEAAKRPALVPPWTRFRGGGGAVDAFEPPYLNLFRCRFRGPILVERSRLRLGEVPVGYAKYRNELFAAERPVDLDLVALLDVAMRLRRGAVDDHFAELARFLRLGLGLEQAEHVEAGVLMEAVHGLNGSICIGGF